MSENAKPIIFSAPMIRALLAGTKTQTRRIMRPQPGVNEQVTTAFGGFHVGRMRDSENAWRPLKCPYGLVGDVLWVREAWRPVFLTSRPRTENLSIVQYAADMNFNRTDWIGTVMGESWRPSIHMPRDFSRLTLELTGVKVERVCDISVEDAKAEGVTMRDDGRMGDSYQEAFADLWDTIHGRDVLCNWRANPWVWCLSFKRLGAT